MLAECHLDLSPRRYITYFQNQTGRILHQKLRLSQRYYILWPFVSIHTIYGRVFLNVHKKRARVKKILTKKFNSPKMNGLGRVHFKEMLRFLLFLNASCRFFICKIGDFCNT